MRELKTCARLHHPNILPVYGYTYGFGLFVAIVCPWARNGNLTRYLEDEDATLTFVRRIEVVSRFFYYMSTHANGDVS
jgi:serine/threonine protein kinase